MSAVAVGSPTVAYEYADQLLQHVVAIIAATDGGPIEHAYVGPGVPALDCETICVWGQTLSYLARQPNSPVDAGHRLVDARVPLFGFGIIVARCVPVTSGPEAADAPTPEQQDAAARIVLQDVWAIWNGLVELFVAGSLFGGRCSELFMDSAVALEPRGGIGGWQVQLRAGLPGYLPGS